MNLDFANILDTGFTLFFAVSMTMILVAVVKQLPKLIVVWAKFNDSIEKNTEIVNKNYEKSVNIVDELKELKAKLICHDENADEILRILKEMENALRKKDII